MLLGELKPFTKSHQPQDGLNLDALHPPTGGLSFPPHPPPIAPPVAPPIAHYRAIESTSRTQVQATAPPPLGAAKPPKHPHQVMWQPRAVAAAAASAAAAAASAAGAADVAGVAAPTAEEP